MTEIVVGVDAGGSKTHIIVTSTSGEELANITGPGAAMSPGNAEHCAGIIASLIENALTSAEETQYRPRIVFAGVAGTGREEEQVALQQALTQREIAEEIVVDTDACIALADAFGEGSGIVLLSGTGSIAFGRSPTGVQARCGGWGITFGDEGSGAWIGRRALSVIASAHDGREPETALTGAILTAAQVNEVEQLIPWAIAANKEMFAALAPSVIAVAMQGDLRSNAIIDMAVEELMLHVRALGKRLFVDERSEFHVALAGGLLAKGSLLRKRLEKRLRGAVPGAIVRPDEVNGARGALKLALNVLNAV
jgi:glucosamine kinase